MYNFINYCEKNITTFFRPDDPEKSFRKNLKNQPNDWVYRSKKIEYCHNKHGFRNTSFEDTDWGSSVVLFGCSNVFGTGLAHEDTISYQLSLMLNLNVINMGLPGSGIDLACYNSLILHNHFPRPKALVHLWSNTNRYCNFENNTSQSDPLPTAATPYHASDHAYISKHDWFRRSYVYRMMDIALWNNKTQYIELSFFKNTAKEFNIPSINTLDFARDLLHPGILSAKEAATEIAKMIKI